MTCVVSTSDESRSPPDFADTAVSGDTDSISSQDFIAVDTVRLFPAVVYVPVNAIVAVCLQFADFPVATSQDREEV